MAKAWREYGITPWREGTFKFSTDPELVAKVVDVVGLYLAPSENAVVLCVDEKSQIQPLKRTSPGLPMQPGKPATRTHDYIRHGTSTLFAALESATGHVTAACKLPALAPGVPRLPQTGRQGLPEPAAAPGDGQLRRAQDPEVKAWLADYPRFQVHFTPTSASWLNLVEVWFGIVEHRANVTFVAELNKIRAFVTGWNDRCHPFVCAKTSTEILKKANRPTTSKTGH